MSGIGEYIKERRKALGLTQRDLADRLSGLGFSYTASTIGWWETNRTNPPVHDKAFLEALAAALETKVGALLEGMKLYTAEMEMKDLSPTEQALVKAYRSGDLQNLLRIALEKSGEESRVKPASS